MSLVCAQCSRVNPSDAAYCYHDGAALAGRAGGPINPGSAPFPGPFVFPNGQSCRNFDQLATACQHNWTSAVDLLKQGFLASFFGGLGRVDLALAAQEAAKFPDPDRGLDQLLAKLPTQVLEAPKLQVEPRQVNLGLLKVGEDRATEIHLTNLGMRLLYGTVGSDCKWLTLGDSPGLPEKIFQFGAEAVIPVQVRGQHLRAANKPLEGKLVVESNGGTSVVTFRAEVPITPYPGGLFAGATTPRQIAEKAKASPKETAPAFENGEVAAWFQSNGWTYPVQGPAMSGMGAVQQFFEALGVAKPPKVEVSTKPLHFQGEPGKRIEFAVDVTSPEKKVVYGWATADVPWVEAGKTKLGGRSATVPLTLTVPNRAGTLEAKLTVVGNGNQKFAVPLRLTVIGGAPYVEEDEPVEMEVFDAEPAAVAAAPPGNPFDVGAPAPLLPAASLLPTAAPAAVADDESDLTVVPPTAFTPPPARPAKGRWLLHVVPLAALALVLFGLVVRDVFHQIYYGGRGPEVAVGDVDTRKLLALSFDYNLDPKKPVKGLSNTLSFGLTRVSSAAGAAEMKRLTFGERGHTNSTVVRIDGKDYQFGNFPASGRFSEPPRPAGKFGGTVATFQFPQPIYVTQEVKLVPGEQPVEVSPGEYKRVLDTVFVRYKIENRDTQPHEVGLRFLLDTWIGDNDGAPFTLPGVAGLVDTMKEFKTAEEVPDFIQVLENPNLKSPGLIAQLNLKLDPARFEVPGKVRLTQHPQYDNGRYKRNWDVPLKTIKELKDSSVALFWEPKTLAPGASREVAFSYGLGDVSIGPDAKLGLTVGGAPVVGGELTVVALVADPQQGQEVRLELPAGMQLVGDSKAVQTVQPGEKTADGRSRPAPATWRVRATDSGQFRLRVETNGVSQERTITVGRSRLF